jgi:hypothetical protein
LPGNHNQALAKVDGWSDETVTSTQQVFDEPALTWCNLLKGAMFHGVCECKGIVIHRVLHTIRGKIISIDGHAT